MNKTVIKSDENIFEVLGVPNASFEKMRLDLMLEIHEWFELSGLTQVKAAKVLACTQPQLSLILKGRYEDFTIERLVKMLDSLGKTVKVNVLEAA
ncbi:MAG: helix-turn-helix domain-containing protein [Cocleimonas sp.]|nr:helix-turn-helix domain-containing protein [Cocleimonas sp.]